MPAFGSCPLVFKSGDSNALVDRVGMANIPGVRYSRCHTGLPERVRGKIPVGGQAHLPSLPPALRLKVTAESSAVRAARETHCHVINVSGSRTFVRSEGELEHKDIQRALGHAHLWIVRFKPELPLLRASSGA